MSEGEIRSVLDSMEVSLVKSKSDLFYMGASLNKEAKQILKVMGLKPMPAFTLKAVLDKEIGKQVSKM